MANTASRRNYKIIILLTAALLLGAVYAVFDPAQSAWMPKCPIHVLTGFDCPGCGSQRALHSLLHGDLAGAARANAILFFFVPLLLLLATAEINRKRWPRFHKAMLHPGVIFGILAVVVCWTIARNILY